MDLPVYLTDRDDNLSGVAPYPVMAPLYPPSTADVAFWFTPVDTIRGLWTNALSHRPHYVDNKWLNMIPSDKMLDHVNGDVRMIKNLHTTYNSTGKSLATVADKELLTSAFSCSRNYHAKLLHVYNNIMNTYNTGKIHLAVSMLNKTNIMFDYAEYLATKRLDCIKQRAPETEFSQITVRRMLDYFDKACAMHVNVVSYLFGQLNWWRRNCLIHKTKYDECCDLLWAVMRLNNTAAMYIARIRSCINY